MTIRSMLLFALASASLTAQTPCVNRGPMPVIPPPYSNQQALCQAPHGQKANLIPPSGPDGNAYSLKLRSFVVNRQYAAAPYNWLHDLTWRLTGEYEGCQNDPNALSFGVHPAVKIYYSPEVIEWLCKGRPGPLPAGAMIVKEMHSISSVSVDASNLMWLADASYASPTEWTVMVKGDNVSADGWFWADYTPGVSSANPPILGISAQTSGAAIPETGGGFYPTGNALSSGDQDSEVYPYSGVGNYCINCHASAIGEATYSTLDNILTPGIRYKWLGASHPAAAERFAMHSEHLFTAATRTLLTAQAPKVQKPYAPLLQADPGFLKLFPQLPNLDFSLLLKTQFPGETYNQAPSRANSEGKAIQQFITSNQCLACHDATANRTPVLPNMILPLGPPGPNQTQVNLSVWAEWSASPMGLAGRDPVFFSQLESEGNLFANLQAPPPAIKEQIDCVQNTCLHCHGVMGQRQLELDNPGNTKRCESLIPTTATRLFTRDIVKAWPGENPADQQYGGLARDGISCAACHHISNEELGQPSTFTGNFKVGPPDKIYGPFSDEVKTKPMEHALGITPAEADQIKKSELCGTCHAILLPVYNGMNVVNARYEQTTYLEWLNSDFADQSCQDCHMPNTYHDKGVNQKLGFKIANIEDDQYPHTDNRLPDGDIDLRSRNGFARHTLVGANVFLNQLFQQFPVLLGSRQKDYMNSNSNVKFPLITAQESFLDMTRNETADIKLGQVSIEGSTLTADVQVSNKTGHHFPSGVGFRRAFIEFLVLDGQGNPLWASGRTSDLGEILNGTTNQPLQTELLPGGAGPDPEECHESPNYQVHHATVTRPDQVQIYEELLQDAQLRFTTSFLHRYQTVKDNRLRPRGWNSTGPYAKETAPEGGCTLQDPEYVSNGHPLKGVDTVRYQVTLPAGAATKVAKVQATLYYQSIPPYYLNQRFDSAKTGPQRDDSQRLYYLTSHLNVAAPKDSAGQPFLKSWKLRIGADSQDLLQR